MPYALFYFTLVLYIIAMHAGVSQGRASVVLDMPSVGFNLVDVLDGSTGATRTLIRRSGPDDEDPDENEEDYDDDEEDDEGEEDEDEEEDEEEDAFEDEEDYEDEDESEEEPSSPAPSTSNQEIVNATNATQMSISLNGSLGSTASLNSSDASGFNSTLVGASSNRPRKGSDTSLFDMTDNDGESAVATLQTGTNATESHSKATIEIKFPAVSVNERQVFNDGDILTFQFPASNYYLSRCEGCLMVLPARSPAEMNDTRRGLQPCPDCLHGNYSGDAEGVLNTAVARHGWPLPVDQWRLKVVPGDTTKNRFYLISNNGRYLSRTDIQPYRLPPGDDQFRIVTVDRLVPDPVRSVWSFVSDGRIWPRLYISNSTEPYDIDQTFALITSSSCAGDGGLPLGFTRLSRVASMAEVFVLAPNVKVITPMELDDLTGATSLPLRFKTGDWIKIMSIIVSYPVSYLSWMQDASYTFDHAYLRPDSRSTPEIMWQVEISDPDRSFLRLKTAKGEYLAPYGLDPRSARLWTLTDLTVDSKPDLYFEARSKNMPGVFRMLSVSWRAYGGFFHWPPLENDVLELKQTAAEGWSFTAEVVPPSEVDARLSTM